MSFTHYFNPRPEALDVPDVLDYGIRDKMMFAQSMTPADSHFAVVGPDWPKGMLAAKDAFIETTLGLAIEPSSWEWAGEPAPTTRTDVGVAHRFVELFDSWTKRTMLTSSLTELIYDIDFQRIIALGPQAIPHLLSHLPQRPVPIFYAMNLLVDEPPVNETATADEAIAAWQQWGRDRGLLG
ncbi:MAG: hypothetical protein JWN65_4089 [Solirubrobacterales bacterium]|nr:hypothetical protein [Solirubrobacterales bacterium]